MGEIALPEVFHSTVRTDLIRKAFIALYTSSIQPKGRDPLAGKKVSVESFGTGREMARLPRHSGGRAGFAPMARGGYKPHTQRVSTVIHERLNQKERRLALASAIAATGNMSLVSSRGHHFDSEKIASLPLIVSEDLESISKTSDARAFLTNTGLAPDVLRVKSSLKTRAGAGKKRGRKNRHGVGPLIVVSKRCPANLAFRNIMGVDVVEVFNLSVLNLAPGGVPGRLTVWSKPSVEALAGESD